MNRHANIYCFIASNSALSVGRNYDPGLCDHDRFIASNSALSVGLEEKLAREYTLGFIASNSAQSVGPKTGALPGS